MVQLKLSIAIILAATVSFILAVPVPVGEVAKKPTRSNATPARGPDGVATRGPPTGSKSMPVKKNIYLKDLSVNQLRARYRKHRANLVKLQEQDKTYSERIKKLRQEGSGKDNMEEINRLREEQMGFQKDMNKSLERLGKYSTHIEARTAKGK